MIGLLQRVTQAQVWVAGSPIATIDAGLLVLVGVQRHDDAASAERLAQRVLDYRVFADDAGRMNQSLAQTGAGLLLVPQFTLAADTRHGARPGFSKAAPPGLAAECFAQMLAAAKARHGPVASGQFGADMQVQSCNDGPVTFWLEVPARSLSGQ